MINNMLGQEKLLLYEDNVNFYVGLSTHLVCITKVHTPHTLLQL